MKIRRTRVTIHKLHSPTVVLQPGGAPFTPNRNALLESDFKVQMLACSAPHGYSLFPWELTGHHRGLIRLPVVDW